MAAYPGYDDVKRIGILGTGTIGASWAAYYLAHGYTVSAWDPGEGWQARMAGYIDNVWLQLEQLGLAPGADKAAIHFCDSASEAVGAADFVQESAPERLEVKQDLYRRIDNALPADTILASSTSGLIMSELQVGLTSAARFVVGHPFNPPHLIPLVEVVCGKASDPAAGAWTVGFYNHIGKHAITVRKEVPGHLANRLQAALWREALMAVANDLASIEDIDAAVAQGPGLRWALMGPHMVLNLAGGKGGMQQTFDHFLPGLQAWWATMRENPTLPPAMRQTILDGLAAEAGRRSIDDLEQERDLRLIGLLKMLKATEAAIKPK